MTEYLEPVAVTGIGIVSPIGIGREPFWAALCAGGSGIRLLDNGSDFPRVVSQVHDFDAKRFIRSAHVRRMDKLSRMIVAASRMALDDARLGVERLAPKRVGVVVGSAFGNVSESVTYLERVFTKGPGFASPMLFPNLVLNAPASYAAMELGATGVNVTVAQGEASGENAIALAAGMIRAGRADVILAGGGDELGSIIIETYRKAKALSGQRGGPQWCSPYDRDRNGIVLGEGAAMLMLEPLQRARERGAVIYAEIDGEACFSIPAPPYDWPLRVHEVPPPLHRLVGSRRVSLVCGCANSSRILDAFEAELVTRLLGEGAAAVEISSIKGAIGEFGAAGALTTAAACLAVHEQTIPPLCHLRRALPAVPLRFASHEGRHRPIERAVVLGIARGGAAVALSLARVSHQES